MDNREKIFAKIRTSFEDLHQYPNAPDEVSFLKYPHRHIFNVIVYIEQYHDDRDVEFFIFKKNLDKIIAEKIVPYKKSKSCEMIAIRLNKEIIKKYGPRDIRIEVNEDDENGAYVMFNNKS